MASGATHGPPFRLPARRADLRRCRETRVFETWRSSIWTSAVIGTVALVTTALNVVPGPSDEIVMVTAYTLTGVLGHFAPIPE